MSQRTPTQKELSEKALRKVGKAEANTASHPENAPSADEGMIATPRENYPPSGAFDAEGREPALRRSRER